MKKNQQKKTSFLEEKIKCLEKDVKCAEDKRISLEQDAEIHLLELHQLQEELEHYFTKAEVLEKSKQNNELLLSQSSPEYLCGTSNICIVKKIQIVDRYETNGYADIHLQLDDLYIGEMGRIDTFRCKLVQKDGSPGIEFRAFDPHSESVLSTWSDEMTDEYGRYILFMPEPNADYVEEQDSLLKRLPDSDRRFLLNILYVIYSHFSVSSVEYLPQLSPAEFFDWRKNAIDLYYQSRKLFNSIGIRGVSIKEEFHDRGYRHLWVNVESYNVGERFFSDFSFKLVAITNEREEKLFIEFRELENNIPPLESWPIGYEDEFGHKLLIELKVVKSELIADIDQALTPFDTLVIKGILENLVNIIHDLKSSDDSSFEWNDIVEPMRNCSVFLGKRQLGFFGKFLKKIQL